MTFPDPPTESTCLERSEADKCGDCEDRRNCQIWLMRQIQRIHDGESIADIATEIWEAL